MLSQSAENINRIWFRLDSNLGRFAILVFLGIGATNRARLTCHIIRGYSPPDKRTDLPLEVGASNSFGRRA